MDKKIIFWTIAGSIATVAATCWTIYVYFVPPKETKPEPVVTQTSTNGTNIGNMAGGSVTINQMLPPTDNTLQGTADSARMIIDRLGVSWSSDAYIGAVVDGDVRVVELFLIGGMSNTLNHKGASAIVYALQPFAENRIEMIKLFLRYGFNPNTNLRDARIMRTYGSIPPHFDQKETPKGYAAWEKVFVGPADLWLTIATSYHGPEEGDFELLELLAKNGADFKASLSFLRTDGASAYDNTPVYWDVRNEVEKAAGQKVTRRPDNLY